MCTALNLIFDCWFFGPAHFVSLTLYQLGLKCPLVKFECLKLSTLNVAFSLQSLCIYQFFKSYIADFSLSEYGTVLSILWIIKAVSHVTKSAHRSVWSSCCSSDLFTIRQCTPDIIASMMCLSTAWQYSCPRCLRNMKILLLVLPWCWFDTVPGLPALALCDRIGPPISALIFFHHSF